MGASWVMLFLLGLTQVLCSEYDNEIAVYNDRPIVGVLSQEIPPYVPECKNYSSFISASYVKFIEGAGAQVVPIWINQTRSYYEDIMKKINGVLFPGGSSNLNAKYGFADAGAEIYEIAQTLNSKGDYFPLWGTCQGFELLAYLGANRTVPLTSCKLREVNLKLEFLPVHKTSKLFGSAPADILEILSSKPVTPNFHKFCLTQENVTRYMEDVNWRLLSLNEDSNGLKFVSSMESRKLPVYGVQFHPEKVLYEWIRSQKIAHSYDAVKTAQYFANFFVNEARKSSHSFPSLDEETKALIYNYKPAYTAREHYENEEVYFFKI